MPSKQENERRKQLNRANAQEQRLAAEARMPISKMDLKGLFNYLDNSLGIHICNHSLDLTKSYLASRQLDETVIVPWLGEYGGYCDCEVLANVEDAWAE